MTILYRPIVDGKAVTMVSISGLTREKAAEYCRGIFGNRFQGFEETQ